MRNAVPATIPLRKPPIAFALALAAIAGWMPVQVVQAAAAQPARAAAAQAVPAPAARREPPAAVPIAIGGGVVALDGPWRFHTGDDARWADPGFDDSAWEAIDLTPPSSGAHDGDVGLTGYVPGWMARGHAGYLGYAWYRLRVAVSAPPGRRLGLAGPPYADGAYQLYFDGRLLGGIGDFSRTPPIAYNRQPRLFWLPAPPAPPLPAAGPPPPPGQPAGSAPPTTVAVVAIRAWLGRGTASSGADGGGIHIAPALGEADGIRARYDQQWIEVFRGYVVDAAQAVVLFLLAVTAWSLTAFERRDRGSARRRAAGPGERPDGALTERRGGNSDLAWMAVALLLTAAVRGNQPLFFWTREWESFRVFDLVRNVLLTPLALGAWMLAWRGWFRLRRPAWLSAAAVTATAVYLAVQALGRAWLPAAVPAALASPLHVAGLVVRLLFVVLFLLILILGARRSPRALPPPHAAQPADSARSPDAGLPPDDRWLALAGMLCTGVAIFAQELSAIGMPGIWFPWDVGVSRTEYALGALAVVLFALFLRRLRAYARACRAPVPVAAGGTELQ